jgi:hypothetical protein
MLSVWDLGVEWESIWADSTEDPANWINVAGLNGFVEGSCDGGEE